MGNRDDPFSNEKFIQKFISRRQEHDSVNLCIDEPAILERVLEILPSSVLEVGCATGGLTKKIAENARKLIALDQSELVILKAKENLKNENVQFICSSIEEYQPQELFNMVISGMCMHLVKDFSKVSNKVYSCLGNDGHFIFTQRHPIRTSNPQGGPHSFDKFGWKVENYFKLDARKYSWLDQQVTCFHRPIGIIVKTLIDSGFKILEIAEPQPVNLENTSKNLENRSIPATLLIHAQKIN